MSDGSEALSYSGWDVTGDQYDSHAPILWLRST